VKKSPPEDDGENIYTVVDNELFDELVQLVGQKVVLVQLWQDTVVESLESSVAEEEEESAANGDGAALFDLDLYLGDGLFFELFGVTLFPSLDGEPMNDFEAINRQLAQWVKTGLSLMDVAVDEEDALVLVLGRRQPQVYLVVGAWSLQEWSELPDEL
jgi:hypothetical protein